MLLSVDDVGDRGGVPVIYLHGTPDSRLSRHPDDGLTRAAGVRLLAVDRPGYGGSELPGGLVPARLYEEFAGSLAGLLDELDIERARLLAWSGGTLPALGVLKTPVLADRIDRLTVVAGVVPREAYQDSEVRAANDSREGLIEMAAEMPAPKFGELVAAMQVPWPCDEVLAAEHQAEHRTMGDNAAVAHVPGARDQLARGMAEAVRPGLGGVMADLEAMYYLGAVTGLDEIVTPVDLWYGTEDVVTPVANGEWYLRHLPDATLHTVDGAVHMLCITHWEPLLRALAS